MTRLPAPQHPDALTVRWLLDALRIGDRPSVALAAGEVHPAGLLPLLHYEQVGAWAWHRLRQAGVLAGASAPLQQELRNLGLAQTAVNLRIAAVTRQVLDLLDREGIRPVLLKGVACCALADRYPFFRYRQTGDVDLLVEPGAAEHAWRVLQHHGFGLASPEPGVHPDHHHLPTLVSDAQISVEIHRSASFFWSSDDSWRRFRGGAGAVAWQGREVLVPPATELLWNGVVHSLGDGGAGCRLRHFLTAAAVIANDDGVDWDLVTSRVARERICDHDSRHPLPRQALRRWLAVAAWLAGRTLPGGLGAGFDPAADLMRLLAFRIRRLAGPRRSPRRQRLMLRWLDEAARAQMSLGLGRLGHWQSAWARPRWLATSALLRLLYRAASRQ